MCDDDISSTRTNLADNEAVLGVQQDILSVLKPRGFEVHPFLIGWYNAQVGEKFRLPYGDTTLAFVVISEPSMFEKSFLPFLMENKAVAQGRDPLDQCMLAQFRQVRELLAGRSVRADCMHDFELLPSRRPRVLVQTAGHVAGAVRFYKSQDYEQLRDKKYYPVCVHPRFGGWFALRGVIVLPDMEAGGLRRREPVSLLGQEQVIRLVSLYNECWRDWRWRDVAAAEERYSELQKSYFDLEPGNRQKFIENFLANQ